jgi:alkylation response protein AidB-like acyl-CoA dehydrogenase
MATELEAARLMIRSGADALDKRDPRRPALRHGQAVRDGRRLQGRQRRAADPRRLRLPAGLSRRAVVRDLRVHQILEGTNEIMRVITAREMFRQ